MQPYSWGQLAQWACVAEVSAPKAGNVHPEASFDDTTWQDFVTSAMVTRPILDRAGDLGVGQTVLRCVRATRDAVGVNTNLGLLLLLAPLCASRDDDDLPRVLATLTMADAEVVFEAIRLAHPGGLGRVDEADVAMSSTMGLLDAMRLAADRDAVARQYVTGFEDVLGELASRLAALSGDGESLDRVIVRVHLEQMAREPDSLIRRKCGDAVAVESQQRAAQVLADDSLFDSFDAWLRTDGHRRNPGTSADLVAAGLFVALRRGDIVEPFAWSQSLAITV